jgi:hypothetical protein
MMSGDEETASAGRLSTTVELVEATGPDTDTRLENQASAEPEEKLARLRRVALPAAQWAAGGRRARSGAFVRILAGAVAYCLPVIALCAALAALLYSAWAIWDIARSAGALDFSSIGGAFERIDVAARVFMASGAYFLLVVTIYLLAATLRSDESWLSFLVIVGCAALVVLIVNISADLAFSLAPANTLSPLERDVIAGLVVGHAIILAVFLRGRRPATQALNNLAFTRRRDAGTLYTGALPRLHVIRFATATPRAANNVPAFLQGEPLDDAARAAPDVEDTGERQKPATR